MHAMRKDELPGKRVSILVFVELALDGHIRLHRQLFSLVSILVFVELALDANEVQTMFTVLGFQSLFSWNLLLMLVIDFIELPQVPMFQSLFSWNLLLMWTMAETSVAMAVFQSLFSWNLLLMGIWRNGYPMGFNVSILVFVELALDELLRKGLN